MPARPRQISLRSTQLLILIGMLLVTSGTVFMVSQINSRRSIEDLADRLGREAARHAALKAEAVLQPAASTLRECITTARRGLLNVTDQETLGEQLVERLRHEEPLSWLSYSDQSGRYAGAYRRPQDGRILFNHSWFKPDGRVHMHEEIIDPDGTRQLLRESDDWKYDPRQRPFYALACDAQGLVWTEPYLWYDNQSYGITAAAALRDEATGAVLGVFTADFQLDILSHFLNNLNLPEQSAVFLVNRRGGVITGPGGLTGKDAYAQTCINTAILSCPTPIARLAVDQPVAYPFEHEGVDYFAVAHMFEIPGGQQWGVVAYIPDDAVLGDVRRNVVWTVVITGVAVALAMMLAMVIARRVTRPLVEIADDLERVGRFDLSGDRTPPSRIREIAVVGETVERMKAGLRSFRRYVPEDVVRRLVAEGREAQLFVEPRNLTIFFSDVEGFSKLAERMEPMALVRGLSDYFTIVDQVITEARGTVDKFIGDGALAFFNAPNPVERHAAVACRAALAIQVRLGIIQKEYEARGGCFPRTRIGLHTGEVLVGNIGTPTRFQYSIVGDAVNLAAALQFLNKLYGTSILVSHELRDAAGEGFEWRRLDKVAAKGRTQGGFVYELMGEAGTVDPARLAARAVYEAALDLHLAGRFHEAAAEFDDALNALPHDRAALSLRVRTQQYIDSPPGPDWDGLYHFAPTINHA